MKVYSFYCGFSYIFYSTDISNTYDIEKSKNQNDTRQTTQDKIRQNNTKQHKTNQNKTFLQCKNKLYKYFSTDHYRVIFSNILFFI